MSSRAPWPIPIFGPRVSSIIVKLTSLHQASRETSSRTIEPESDAHVTVSYRAPNSDADEQREISLTYREPAAPRIVFQIQTQVRKSMVLDTDRVALEDFTDDPTASKRILVENYSGIAWSDIRFEQHPDWLEFAAQRRRQPTAAEGPREVWAVDIRANGDW